MSARDAIVRIIFTFTLSSILFFVLMCKEKDKNKMTEAEICLESVYSCFTETRE